MRKSAPQKNQKVTTKRVATRGSFKPTNAARLGITGPSLVNPRSAATRGLIQILNEIDEATGQHRLDRMLRELVGQATGSINDEWETRKTKNGHERVKGKPPTKLGHGSLEAIRAVWDRLEGKPVQRVQTEDETPQQFKSIEEVMGALAMKGVDIGRVLDAVRAPMKPAILLEQRAVEVDEGGVSLDKREKEK